MKLDILKNLFAIVLCSLFVSSLAACGGSGGGDGDVAGSTAGQGILSTSLTDSSTDQYQAVYVTIARVEVHHDSGGTWQTVAEPNQTYNLLELVNGVRETLGIASLDAGHYTQMRLIIGETAEPGSLNIFSVPHPFANYVIDLNGDAHQLKVPSGTNTGLKVVNGFDINENQTTELILDFDAMRSVVKAGASGQYLLKPTIKVLNTTEYAIVSGQVTDADMDPISPMEGAMVTAQVADNSQPDAKDQVVIEAGTLTDMNGDYALFLAPGGYNLVATEEGYYPACIATSLSADEVKTMTDFSLNSPTDALGSIFGTVTITNDQTDQYATIDFRQEITCVNAATVLISIKTINVADGGDYSVALPAGTYQVVSSTFGKETVTVSSVTVISGSSTEEDIAFNTVP
ncbi:MAG: DUF4382 domain-containing protein [Desulfuromonadales bacterium]